MKKIVSAFFLPLLFSLSSELFSQNFDLDYKPNRDFRAPKALIKDLSAKFNAWTGKTTLKNSKAKSIFNKTAKEKSTFIYSLDTSKLIMYNDTLTFFLNGLRDNIVSNNPLLSGKKYTVFTYRNDEANAFNLGEGVILMTTGLLTRLRSADEIAFIMCHEIGHDLLDHVFRGMETLCEDLCSKDFKRKIKAISSKTYGRNAEYERLMSSFYATHMGYSRKHELEADSLGYILFANAGYDLQAASDAMSILDSADYIRYPDTLDLRHSFDFSDHPFKAQWMTQDNSKPLWERDSLLFAIPDSMKTHPDCKVRLERFAEYKAERNNIASKVVQDQASRMVMLKTLSEFEDLEALMHDDNYVDAMYIALHMQAKYPNNLFLKCVVANCLYELSFALKRNEYSKYVDFPDKEYSNGYNQLLTFLQNMNSSTLQVLFITYYGHHTAQTASTPYTAYLNILKKNLEHPEMDLAGEIKKYELEYKDPHFALLLKYKNATSLKPKKK